MTTVVGIIQARMGSSRLPGKVLKDVAGKPMLEHQIERVRRAETLDEIVVATSTSDEDRPILELAKELGVSSYTGSEEDVLDRMYKAAKAHGADVVVRLTGDCPLIEPNVVDWLVSTYLDRPSEIDYVATDPSFPEGYDAEVLDYKALQTAWEEADTRYEREHVTTYIWQSGKFETERLGHEPDLSHVRLTVDEPADLELVREVYQRLYPEEGYDFTTDDVLRVLEEDPELTELNEPVTRNEGLLDSLREERQGPLADQERDLSRSELIWERADGLIPAGTQTLSKGPSQFVDGVAPKYIQRGEGSRVWDADGNEYIDYPMALGSIILGHGYPAVTEAIREQLEDGTTFSMMHPIEVEVAELLRELIPCAEMVRFGKNGSDATTGAIRVARAYTGREKVAHCGYHGWHDWFIGSKSRNRGVPEWAIRQQFKFDYNDIESLKRIFEENPDEIAAVIMEPYVAEEPKDGFLKDAAELTRDHGAVLVFDEVASGFRFHVGGVHQTLGVDPDLACFGKAMANGMPISALVGRSEVMQELDDVFYSFTFGGECLSLAATKATVQEMQQKDVIGHLETLGTRLESNLERLISDLGLKNRVECLSRPHRLFLHFEETDELPSLLQKSLFQQEAFKRGILFNGAHCLSYSHSVDDIEYTLGAYQEALEALAEVETEDAIQERLEGRPVQPVFREMTG